MNGLTLMQRAESAVHCSLEHAGLFRGRRALKGVLPDDVRNAVVAGLEVLAAEFGSQKTAALDQVRAELRAIADASRFDPKDNPEDVLAELRERAAEALNVLDGEVTR